MRFKLLKISLPLAFPKLAVILSSYGYKEVEGSSKGFEIFESHDKALNARFINKKVEEGYVLGPFGGEERVVNVSFDFFEFFSWPKGDGEAYLLLKNPPRGLKPFFQEMKKVLGLGFSVSEIKFSALAFLESLEKIKGADFSKVSKVKVGGVAVSSKSQASIEIGSSGNALKEAEDFIGDRSFTVDKLRFESFFGSISFKGEVSRTGLVAGPEAFFDYMGEEIREVLASSCLEK